jgi:hypothetical protein
VSTGYLPLARAQVVAAAVQDNRKDDPDDVFALANAIEVVAREVLRLKAIVVGENE